jgi:prepilin-type N-terminal cleavage/methylation domain-containing protein
MHRTARWNQSRTKKPAVDLLGILRQAKDFAMQRRAGVTFVELLLVIAIIGILVALRGTAAAIVPRPA